MVDISFLYKLLLTDSPDGFESQTAVKVFKEYCEKFSKFQFEDTMGNIAFSVGEGKIPVMISAHIDEIGMKVQYIDDNGFIYFIKNGGIDPKVLCGSKVTILSSKSKEPIYGVIGKKPIHVEFRDEELKKFIDIKDMKIDCGFESKEEASNLLSIGDNIVMYTTPMTIGKNRISGKGLDDKVGICILAEVMKRLSNETINNLQVYGVAVTQEETGGAGAIRATKAVNPLLSIDYDVTFATDDGFVDPKVWGDIKLGKGGAIAYSPDCDMILCKNLKDTCIENGIPFQEFSKPSGMTNTSKIRDTSFNSRTALVSIPLRNMHTQVEVCDFRDFESIVDMTVGVILAMDKKINN